MDSQPRGCTNKYHTAPGVVNRPSSEAGQEPPPTHPRTDWIQGVQGRAPTTEQYHRPPSCCTCRHQQLWFSKLIVLNLQSWDSDCLDSGDGGGGGVFDIPDLVLQQLYIYHLYSIAGARPSGHLAVYPGDTSVQQLRRCDAALRH